MGQKSNTSIKMGYRIFDFGPIITQPMFFYIVLFELIKNYYYYYYLVFVFVVKNSFDEIQKLIKQTEVRKSGPTFYARCTRIDSSKLKYDIDIQLLFGPFNKHSQNSQ